MIKLNAGDHRNNGLPDVAPECQERLRMGEWSAMDVQEFRDGKGEMLTRA